MLHVLGVAWETYHVWVMWVTHYDTSLLAKKMILIFGNWYLTVFRSREGHCEGQPCFPGHRRYSPVTSNM